MNTANASFRLLGLGRGRRVQPADDPADMGTCFGLDFALDHPEPATARPVEAAVASHWWQRLAVRRRSVD